jgi:hypothetical protein
MGTPDPIEDRQKELIVTPQARVKGMIILAAVVAYTMLPAQAVQGSWGKVLKRPPPDANALVIIDFEGLLNSKLARIKGWRKDLADEYARKPVSVPPGSKHLSMVALLDTSTMDPNWQIAILEADDAPSIETIAERKNGLVGKVGGKSAAWSDVSPYFVELERGLLAMVYPPNRQFVSRWLKQRQRGSAGFASSYLRRVATDAGKDAGVMMALDMEDAWSVAGILEAMEQRPLEALKGKEDQFGAIAELVSSMKGLTLKIRVDEDIRGEGVVDFGADAALLKDFGKALLLEVLGRHGMYLEDFEEWSVSVEGKKMSLKGKLSFDAFDRLLSVIEAPSPPAAEAAAAQPGESGEGEPDAAEASEPDVAKASQEYYRAVMEILDNIQQKLGTGSEGASLARTAAWLKRDARRIDRLPILHVDEELVRWSGEVSSALSEIGSMANVGSLRTRSRTVAMQSTYVGGSTVAGTGGRSRRIRRAQNRAISGQRQAAAMEEKVNVYEQAEQAWQALRGTAAKMRVDLTNRYGVEF